MQYFYINCGSINPTLRMELIDDGRYDFMKNTSFNEAIQNADITFTMKDSNDKVKISKAPCTIILNEDGNCVTRYIIEYAWRPRDVNKKGSYRGYFEIKFLGDLSKPSTMSENGINYDYPKGNYIMPINEDLTIMIK